jgi:hypothetical protein
MHASGMGTMASGQPQPGSLRVARRVRQACAGAMLMATNRGVLLLPFVPGSAACSWQAGHRLRGSLAGARSTAVDLSLRTKTLPVLPRRRIGRLIDVVLRPPWWPQRPLPWAGSPLVRPAGFTRRPTGGGGRGYVLPCFQGPGEGKGRMCRIRSRIWVSISLRPTRQYVFLHQAVSALISEMTVLISRVSVRWGGWL